MLVTHLLVFLYIPCFVYSLEENPKIIIVGAGSSGIAAATKLWKANFTNLQILEAEPRIGGRINSIQFGEAYVDLGAAWCHGEKDNIVYNMAKKYLKHSDKENTKLIYSNGSYVDEEIVKSLQEYSQSIDPYRSFGFIPSNKDDLNILNRCKGLTSTGACFDKTIKPTFSQIYQNDIDKLKIALESAYWIRSYMLALTSSFTHHDVYIETDFRISEGDFFLNWNGLGYKTVLELMMQKFPDPSKQLPIDSNILLNKEVARIIWNNKTKVLVECQDNTSYEADHVIFTPSLGVLKENYQTMFQPSLPEDKINAIRTAGFGTILKIILHFPETWWELDGIYGFIWSTEDVRRTLLEFGKGPVRNGRSWLTAATLIVTSKNNPKVVTILFTGDMIQEIEKEDNQMLKDGCFYMLKKFLGKNRTTIEPDDILKSTWYSNPHFRGTYSYDSVEGNAVQHKFPDKLASPLMTEDGKPVVQFAGEATHPRYYGMVHASIETGFREADRIIELYTKQ